jgi:hypothetical protein
MPGWAAERERAVSLEKLEEAVVGRNAIVAESAQKLRGRGPGELQEDRTDVITPGVILLEITPGVISLVTSHMTGRDTLSA